MITLKSVEVIESIVTLFMAYLVVVSVSGAFRALAAKISGDNTAKHAGFLTLNPLPHIDVIGVFVLFLVGFGWGRHVPINPFNISGKFRSLKIAFCYMSDVIANILLAILASFIFVLMFGLNKLALWLPITVSKNLSLYNLMKTSPGTPSIFLVLALIMLSIIYLSIILAVLNSIINGFGLGMLFSKQDKTGFLDKSDFLTFLIPIILILFFSDPLRRIILIIVYKMTSILALMFGIG